MPVLNSFLHILGNFNGIGDTSENYIEHMHQRSAWMELHVNHMKNREQQAFVHSRMEGIQSNFQVLAKKEERNRDAKCKMRGSTMELLL
jgi:hypothetical protein